MNFVPSKGNCLPVIVYIDVGSILVWSCFPCRCWHCLVTVVQFSILRTCPQQPDSRPHSVTSPQLSMTSPQGSVTSQYPNHSVNITKMWSHDGSSIEGVSGSDRAADTHKLLKQMASHNTSYNDITSMSLELHVNTRGMHLSL